MTPIWQIAFLVAIIAIVAVTLVLGKFIHEGTKQQRARHRGGRR